MTNPALWTAILGVVGAIAALVKQFMHANGPAHNPQPNPAQPPSQGTRVPPAAPPAPKAP